jgi:hypothetical protein
MSDPYRQCHHGVARQPDFVSPVLYDDVYQGSVGRDTHDAI